MNKRELQIGDWVNLNGVSPRYSIVTALGNDGVNVCNYWMEEDCIGPIPLSPEILEKNGFKLVDDAGIYEKLLGPSHSLQYDFRHCEFDEYSTSGHTEPIDEHDFHCRFVCFVHEIQHVLRLCGLDELADKFVA